MKLFNLLVMDCTKGNEGLPNTYSYLKKSRDEVFEELFNTFARPYIEVGGKSEFIEAIQERQIEIYEPKLITKGDLTTMTDEELKAILDSLDMQEKKETCFWWVSSQEFGDKTVDYTIHEFEVEPPAIPFIEITAAQADELPESGSLASTPDDEDYYLNLQEARDLEQEEDLKKLIPELAEHFEKNTEVVKLYV